MTAKIHIILLRFGWLRYFYENFLGIKGSKYVRNLNRYEWRDVDIILKKLNNRLSETSEFENEADFRPTGRLFDTFCKVLNIKALRKTYFSATRFVPNLKLICRKLQRDLRQTTPRFAANHTLIYVKRHLLRYHLSRSEMASEPLKCHLPR